jgi:hypothetical protein
MAGAALTALSMHDLTNVPRAKRAALLAESEEEDPSFRGASQSI